MMGFGSSHVYRYDCSDEESLSDEELDCGLALAASSDEEFEDYGREEMPLPRGSTRAGFKGPLGRRLLSQKESPVSVRGNTKKRRSWNPFGLFRSVQSEEKKTEDRPQPARALKISKAGKRRCRRADTNVVTVKLESLIKPSDMHTGEAERCANCSVVLSHLSQLTNTDQQEEKIWNCGFCGHTNIIDLMPEEVPKKEDITYMLEPAVATAASGSSGIDESLVVFCIDISGSMCVTTEVPGRVHLRGDRLQQLQSLNTEHENQFRPGERRDVTYVSRLQGMQGAVDHQLEQMKKDYPNRRVALIAFNNEVVIYGDGSKDAIHLAEHRLSEKDDLIKMGSEALLPKPIKDSRKILGDKIFDLEEGGPTALGPALLFSVALACQVPGSKVIVCTDGKANVGLGALDKEDLGAASKFYEEVSAMAVSKGVSVSVTTIKGTDCRMEELGIVADATGGQVNIVDPLRLTQEFGSILADPVIATNVTATFITHKGLYIREEGAIDNKVVRYVGNVTLNSEITFEFGIKEKTRKRMQKKAKVQSKSKTEEPVKEVPKEEEMKEEENVTEEDQKGAASAEAGAGASAQPGSSSAPDINVLENLSELPFQLQITYTDLEGAKALRVVTQSKPVTTDREVAEQNVNVEVLGIHTAQKSAALAQQGKYQSSRMYAHTNNNLVMNFLGKKKANRTARRKHKELFTDISGLERQLFQQQASERAVHGVDLDDEMCDLIPIERQSEVLNLRSRERDDELARTTYQLKKKSSKPN